MFAEAFVYLRSLPATPAGFRKNLYEAVGLWARGRRQAAAWAPHIANTRGLIDPAIDDFAVRRTVVVLGSGPLFDVPLEALARTFSMVILVDHAHLATTDARVGRYDNVVREWRDLSAATQVGPLAFLNDIPDLDWVISVNLVSQLARAAPAGREREVVDAHLDGLAALTCRTTLVTDVDYRITDNAGSVLENADLLYGRATPRPDLTWKWEVAPFGEESPDRRRVHAVSAWLDWRKAVDAA
jgi:hypothetical protein